MSEQAISAMEGNVAALSMTISAIIQSLPGDMAALAAQRLAENLATAQRHDAEDETNPDSIPARDLIAETYVELLSTIAKLRGG